MSAEDERQVALNAYRAKLIESREWEAKLKNLRLEIKDLQKEYDRTEENIKALQSVGQIIGEVLKQLDDERCMAPVYPPMTLGMGKLSCYIWESDADFERLQLSSRHRRAPVMLSAADLRLIRRS